MLAAGYEGKKSSRTAGKKNQLQLLPARQAKSRREGGNLQIGEVRPPELVHRRCRVGESGSLPLVTCCCRSAFGSYQVTFSQNQFSFRDRIPDMFDAEWRQVGLRMCHARPLHIFRNELRY